MELTKDTMTVKCEGGCLTKPYDHFERIIDLEGKNLHESVYFEDNRNFNWEI